MPKMAAWLALAACAALLRPSAAYITWANGTVQTIEEIWLEGPDKPCCYDIPKDTMQSVDPAFAVYSEPGCKPATRTCKWPAPIASIWVCNCTGTPSVTSVITPKPGSCCGNVATNTSAPVGAYWRPSNNATKCVTHDDTQVFLGRGIPIKIDCYYDPVVYKGITGLVMHYGPKRTLEWPRGGTWGTVVNSMTTLGGVNGEKITQFRAKWSKTGVIEYIEFNTTEGSVWSCGDDMLSPGKPRTYYAPAAKGLPDARAKRTGQWLGSWIVKVCKFRGMDVISALTPVWARDATYWPYPGLVDGKPMWDTNVTIPRKSKVYTPGPWLKAAPAPKAPAPKPTGK